MILGGKLREYSFVKLPYLEFLLFIKGMESLDMVWTSRANSLQRKGRAGRVTSGVAFHMFTSHRFQQIMRPQPIPEIHR